MYCLNGIGIFALQSTNLLLFGSLSVDGGGEREKAFRVIVAVMFVTRLQYFHLNECICFGIGFMKRAAQMKV